MKHGLNHLQTILRRATAAMCALLAALSVNGPAAAYSYAMGDELRLADTDLHRETQLSENVFWSTVYSDFRTEHFITYKPNEAVRPVVTYGGSMTRVSTLSTAAKQLEAQGYRVVGGINGDFYNTGNGIPVGLVVAEGQLRTSDGGYYALGFRRNGTAVMGKPALTISADLGYTLYDESGYGTRVVRPIAAVNKTRNAGGVYLFTYDFNSTHTTGNSLAGVDAVCTITEGQLSIGGTVKARVTQILDKTGGSTPVEPNQIVLSVSSNSTYYWTNALRSLPVGTEISISVAAADPAWNDVEYGMGSLYVFAENGKIASGLLNDVSPRTAVGRRYDGTLIFYTVDGRLKGHSVGSTMAQTAERLLELGCDTVLGLDGGGSTTLTVTQPDERTAVTINSPSEHVERAVSDQIFLIADGSATGVLDHFFIRTEDNYVLAGSKSTVTVSGADTHYIPMSPGEYTLAASAGTMNGTTFTAPAYTADVTIAASNISGQTGSTVIHVVGTPDSVEIHNSEGAAVSSLTVAPEGEVRLTASAMYRRLPLHADANSFTWSVAGGIGEINDMGVFRALRPGSGTITVRAGERTASIPVTVSSVPLMNAEDFEDEIPGTGDTASLTIATGGELARYGRSSGRLDYDLTVTGRAQWRANQPFINLNIPYDAVSLWVKGDDSGNTLSLLYRTGMGEEASMPVCTLNYTGWRQVILPLGYGTGAAPVGFEVTAPGVASAPLGGGTSADPWAAPINTADPWAAPVTGTDTADSTDAPNNPDAVLTDNPDGILPDSIDSPVTDPTVTTQPENDPLRGSVYLDQMTATYDNIIDTVPPVVDISLNEADWAIQATVRDGGDGVLPQSSVTVTCNGWARQFDYNPSTGYVHWYLPAAGETQEPARVTVTATDASGNIGRASVDIPPYNNQHHFTDIDGCWAADYIDYLYVNNIAQPLEGGKYEPYEIITRVQFAVMLARAVGLDGRNYADVVLPYADIDQIPESALPALRALWKENIMRGADGEDGLLYLYPHSGLTRAQASAMIGRSQRLGYASTEYLSFPDAAAIPTYALSHIQTMVARGILQGYQDGTFRPQANISRGQMAKILYFLA